MSPSIESGLMMHDEIESKIRGLFPLLVNAPSFPFAPLELSLEQPEMTNDVNSIANAWVSAIDFLFMLILLTVLIIT